MADDFYSDSHRGVLLRQRVWRGMHSLRRATLVMIGSLVVVGIAGTATTIAGPLEDQLARTKQEERAVKAELSTMDDRQDRVLGQIQGVNTRINAITVPINELTGRIDDLSERIGHRENRIVQLRREYLQQKVEIVRLDGQLDIARERLSSRLVAVYKNGDEGYEWMSGIRSMADLFTRQEVVRQVTDHDNAVADRISVLQQKLREKRARNSDLREQMRSEISSIAAERREEASARAELISRRSSLSAVKAERDQLLRKLQRQERTLDAQLDRLEDDSAVLKRAIESGATTFAGGVPNVSSAGFVWPANGPVVSRFGPRWGRMHEGWDIAVPAGTPLHAVQSGIVTYSGWMSGYGNLVIVQHAGSLSTAYAHMSRLGAAVGQVVGQGQVIGFVGCTGHCFGDHVHFETRINGNAVDPDNYL